MLTRTRPATNAEEGAGRYGAAVSYNRYSYKPRPMPPTLTLDQLRAEHERLIAPLLRTDSQAK